MRERDRQRKIKAALEGIAACEHALAVEPCGVYERSLRHWRRVLAELRPEPEPGGGDGAP